MLSWDIRSVHQRQPAARNVVHAVHARNAVQDELQRQPRTAEVLESSKDSKETLEELDNDVLHSARNAEQGLQTVRTDTKRDHFFREEGPVPAGEEARGMNVPEQARGMNVLCIDERQLQEQAVEPAAREPRGKYSVVLDGVQVGYDVDEQGCVLVCSARHVQRAFLATTCLQ